MMKSSATHPATQHDHDAEGLLWPELLPDGMERQTFTSPSGREGPIREKLEQWAKLRRERLKEGPRQVTRAGAYGPCRNVRGLMRKRLIAAAAIGLMLGAGAIAEPLREAVKVFTASDALCSSSPRSLEYSPGMERWLPMCASRRTRMTDRFRRSIWLVDEAGRRPLAQLLHGPVASPRTRSLIPPSRYWRIAPVQHGVVARRYAVALAGASNLSWSPDGRMLAFQSFVKEAGVQPAPLPPKPEGATWADPVRSTTRSTIAPTVADWSTAVIRRSSSCRSMAARRGS